MSGRYAQGTDVPAERSRAEIERTLSRYGAEGFLYGWDRERHVMAFRLGGRLLDGRTWDEYPVVRLAEAA